MNPTHYESISVTWAIVSQNFVLWFRRQKLHIFLTNSCLSLDRCSCLSWENFFLEDYSCGFSCFEWELCLLLLKRFNTEYGSFESEFSLAVFIKKFSALSKLWACISTRSYRKRSSCKSFIEQTFGKFNNFTFQVNVRQLSIFLSYELI